MDHPECQFCHGQGQWQYYDRDSGEIHEQSCNHCMGSGFHRTSLTIGTKADLDKTMAACIEAVEKLTKRSKVIPE